VSYRELPVRLADFSALHRNEATGALGGLTRLRKFQQDDAHIFCAREHIEAEVHGCLDFVAAVYRLFGFSFRLVLSTRPAAHVGDGATWDHAEAALGGALASFLAAHPAHAGGGGGGGEAAAGGGGTRLPPNLAALVSCVPAASPPAAAADPDASATTTTTTTTTTTAPPRGRGYDVDAGGGAFYGPKIDVFVRDALGREHQCATVQLDFQLPARFGLEFTDVERRRAPPVIIHRAILGSVERMFGILAEHTGGRWPFWLSPRQLLLCPVAERHNAYAEAAAAALRAGGGQEGAGASALHVEVDASARTVAKRVREAQVAQWNVVGVVGDAEAATGTVALRFRDAATWAEFAAAAGEAVGGADGEGGAGSGMLPLVTLPLAALRDVCARLAVPAVG
jgi:threonyl-tRNA synthetase